VVLPLVLVVLAVVKELETELTVLIFFLLSSLFEKLSAIHAFVSDCLVIV